MIPVISATAYTAAFEDKQGRRTEPLIAYCVGGPAINDTSSLYNTQWVATVEDDEVRIRVEGSSDYVVVTTASGLEFISLAFDSQMNPIIAYVQSGVAKLRWYNSLTTSFEVVKFPAGSGHPLLALDLREQIFLADADVVVSYVRSNNLYARVQRESFATERLLRENAGREVVSFGRNQGNRLQWRLLPIIT